MQKILFLICIALISSMAQSASFDDTLALLKRLSPRFKNYDLAKLEQVAEIKVSNTKITDGELELLTPLCQLENIKILNFISNRLTGAGLKYFSESGIECKSITRIDLGGCP